jgi:hypothetical protein
MTADRVRRIEAVDPRMGIGSPVARHCGLDLRRCERVERWRNQLDAGSTGTRAGGYELMVGAIRQQPRRASERAAHGRLPAPSIAEVGHEIPPGSKGMPTAARHERARRGVPRPRHRASVVVAPPAIRALPTRVAAIQLRTTRTARAMRGAVTNRAPPGLDDVGGKVRQKWSGVALAHRSILNEGCHVPNRHAASANTGCRNRRLNRERTQ